MKIKNLTWLGFFITLSTVAIAPKTLAIDSNNQEISESNTVENRLNRIAEILKNRADNLPENEQKSFNQEILLGGFINGGGGFANVRGGGGFVNGGGGGFLNNRGGWGDGGGGFLNRRF